MNVNTAIDLLLTLSLQAARISELIRTIRAEGRETFTKEELALLRAEDDAARARLQAAIDAA